MKRFYLILLPILLTVKPFLQEDLPSLDLATPYDAVYLHLFYLQPDSYRPGLAAQAFPAAIDSTARVDAAIQLKQILDGRGLYVNLNHIPIDTNFVDSLSGRHLFTIFPGELPNVFVEKKGEKWTYSLATVKALPAMHKELYPFGTDRILKLLPQKGYRRYFGLMLWQFIGLLVLIALAYLSHLLLSRILRPMVRLLANTRLRAWNISKQNTWKVAKAVSYFLIIELIRVLLPVLQLPISWSAFAISLLKIITALVLVLLAVRLLRIVMDYLSLLAQSTESKLDDQLIPIVRKISVFAIFIIAAFQIMSVLNVNITALIAGISIGGLAVALAAQDTIKNLIGSLNIFVDKPFQIGDYVTDGNFEGTVEEVGFRTTRIRKIDSSIISVPNSKITDASVNNLGLRPKRMIRMTIGVTYDTPPHLIELFVEGLKKIVLGHPKLDHETVYIHLNEFGASSLNIMFRAYIKTLDYGQELIVREEVLMSTMRLARTLGVRFAFPSSTLYIEDFPEKKTLVPDYPKSEKELRETMNLFLKKYEETLRESYEEGSSAEDESHR